MKLAIIAGSARAKSQSARVSRYIADRAATLFVDCSFPLIDLAATPLSYWSGDFMSHPADTGDPAWSETSSTLESADGIIVVVPEYHGMAPPALMNLILLCRYELAHKPGLIIGISATDGGAYPTVQLRGSVAKNNRICWIPDQVVIRNVKQALVDQNGDEPDRMKSRIDYGLRLLISYSEALRSVRKSGLVDHKTFSFGQ